MTTPHVHAELIKKWAVNPVLEIEQRERDDGKWFPIYGNPEWRSCYQYRIKPRLVKQEGWMLVEAPPVFPPTNIRITSNLYDDREVAVEVQRKSSTKYQLIKVEWEEEINE